MCGRGAYTLAWHRGKAIGRKVVARVSSCGRSWSTWSVFYISFDNMEYRVLNGYLMVLLIQHCISKGRSWKVLTVTDHLLLFFKNVPLLHIL